MIPTLGLLSWLLSVGEFYLEAGPYASREQAETAKASLAVAPSTRVVRRFQVGPGWEYVVRVGGFDDEATLRAYAGMAQGLSVALYERVGGEHRRIDGLVLQPQDPEADLVIEPGKTLRTTTLLRAAIKAHGGKEGGLRVLELAPTVVFDYERTVAREGGNTIAAHRFVRAGEAMRLDVDVTSGPGVDSCTVLAPDRRAWVSTDASALSRDPERTAVVLSRFSPEGLLAVPLGIPQDMEMSGPWRELSGAATIQGDRVVASVERVDAPGLVAAEFGTTDHLLRRLDWVLPTGRISYTFDDYRVVREGLVVPFSSAVTKDGAVIESMKVTRLEIGVVVTADMFAIPEEAPIPAP